MLLLSLIIEERIHGMWYRYARRKTKKTTEQEAPAIVGIFENSAQIAGCSHLQNCISDHNGFVSLARRTSVISII
jgi:hypothetical protein